MTHIRNVANGKYGIEGEVYFSEFDKYISLLVEDDDLKFAEECAEYLNSLPAKVIDHLCEASIRYCNDFLDCIGEPIKAFDKSRDVLKLVYPSVFIVPP